MGFPKHQKYGFVLVDFCGAVFFLLFLAGELLGEKKILSGITYLKKCSEKICSVSFERIQQS